MDYYNVSNDLVGEIKRVYDVKVHTSTVRRVRLKNGFYSLFAVKSLLITIQLNTLSNLNKDIDTAKSGRDQG